METFELPVGLRVKGNKDKIFECWTNPERAKEWLCDRLEGSWTPGETLSWVFGSYRQELKIVEVVPGQSLKFRWKVGGNRPETEALVTFEQVGNETALRLREKHFDLTQEGVRFAIDGASGWENIFCRLKAWVEFGAKLR